MPVSQLAGSSNAGDSSKTFVFQGEGHTLGNALKSIVMTYADVEFCAYTVPHPMEATMHFRVQMRSGKAVDALRRGLEDLAALCDHVVDVFQKETDNFQS